MNVPMRFDGTFSPCPRCNRETSTGLIHLSSGHVGRVCVECHALRKGKPYASRREYAVASFNQPMPTGAEGQRHVTASSPQ